MNTPENQLKTSNNAVVARPIPPDQISPKSVLLRIFGLKDVFRRYWKLVLAFTVIGGAIGKFIDIAEKRQPVYTASIKFNLGGGEGAAGNMGGLGAFASAFGLGGAAPDANIFTGDNFMIYAKSRPVVEKTLMKTVNINGKDTLLANYYIRHSGIRDNEWEDSDTLRMFYFNGPKKTVDFTKQEHIAMSQIYAKIKNGEINIDQPERKSSFMELKVGMEDEGLAKTFVETHLNTLKEDYKEKQTKKSSEMVTLLHSRTDSLYRVLTGNENRLAEYMDQNQQLVIAQGRLTEAKLGRNTTFLTQQYYQALQSEENMRLSLVRESPLFTIIEPVQLPLYKEVITSIAMQAGIILGLILSLLIVFLRETYLSVMREE
jgi:hypothetical protein